MEVSHVYPSGYLVPAPEDPAFLQAGGILLSGVPGRAETAVRSISSGSIGALQSLGSEGLGGWTIDAHHHFDPETRTLSFGSGGHRVFGGAGREPEVLYRVAGTGTPGSTGDGGPAREATLSQPYGLSLNGRGELLIAESGSCRIRKVDGEGIISTIAGSECIPPSPGGAVGDGGPATSASLYLPKKAIEAADGAVFIADAGNHRVRRIDRDGIIETVLGTGAWGCASTSNQGTSTEIIAPTDLAFDPSGDLLVVDSAHPLDAPCRSLKRLSGEGRVRDLLRGAASVPATCQTPGCTPFPLVDPTGVAPAPDGTVYFTQKLELPRFRGH